MNKKGSHIDVIISFIIFISFIVFSYVILQPTLTTQEGKTSLASSLDKSLVDNLSGGNLTVISFGVKQNIQRNCIQLTGFLNNANISRNTIVLRNSTGAIFPVYNSSSDLYVDISSNQQLNYFFDVYYSPNFNLIPSGTLSNCNVLSQGSSSNSYAIGQIFSSSQYIFDFNILKLINSYNSNYIALKNWFNISGADNFGFNFTYQNQTIIGTNSRVPPFSSTYAEGFPILYVTGNNSLQSGLLTIRVW
jgi:hypothetical protein